MPDLINPVPCVHTLLEGGIHEFAFNQASREAVDQLFVLLTQVYDLDALPPDQAVALLFDFKQRDLPLAYTFMSFQKWLSGRESHRYARLAIVTNTHMMIPIVETFLRAVRNDYLQVRFFPPVQRADAETWLLQDE